MRNSAAFNSRSKSSQKEDRTGAGQVKVTEGPGRRQPATERMHSGTPGEEPVRMALRDLLARSFYWVKTQRFQI
jgi:hypothetical protein